MPRAFTDNEKASIRRRLLLEGRRAVARSGFRATTVEALCRSAGISKGAFYAFFPSKEALFMELLQNVEREQRRDLEATLALPHATSEELVSRFLRHVFDALRREPVLAALATPEDAAYLVRSVPPEELHRRKLEDDRYFEEILSGVEGARHRRGRRSARLLRPAQGRARLADAARHDRRGARRRRLGAVRGEPRA